VYRMTSVSDQARSIVVKSGLEWVSSISLDLRSGSP
jgi:hypothetical protein